MPAALPRRVVALGLLCSGLALGCTQPAPWSSQEGTPGQPCFPDETCDPGLTCVVGVCQAGGSWDLGGPRVDRALHDRGTRDKRPTDAPRPDKLVCSGGPPPPSVSSYPKSTSFPKAAVKGTAPGAATVQVQGGAASASAPVVGGAFCVMVQLWPAATSTLKLVSLDAKGCPSAPALLDIQQQTTPVDLVYGMTATTIRQPDQGQLSALTDGLLSTSVRFSFWDPLPACDEHEHLWFDLGSSKSIDKVVVHYPQKSGFKYYATCWSLLVSDKASPVAPDPANPDWKVVQSATSGGSGDLTLPVGAPARHVALLLYEDGVSNPLYSTFEVTELEVWGPGDPPTCP